MSRGQKHALAAATIYVVAVAALLASQPEELPEPIAALLELREVTFLTRALPPPGSDLPIPIPLSAISDHLTDLARRSFPSDEARLEAAAVSVALSQRQLVPLFVGPLAFRDPLARALTRWAFDPSPHFQETDFEAIYGAPIQEHLKDHLLFAFASSSGLTEMAALAKERVTERARKAALKGAFATALGLLALILGVYFWVRLARRRPSDSSPQLPLTSQTIVPMLAAMVYFLAVFLTLSALGPLLFSTFLSPAAQTFAIYSISGLLGLWVIHVAGRGNDKRPFLDLVGLRGPLRPLRALLFALEGYLMALPAVIGATILWSAVASKGSGAFDNPVAVLLVTEEDIPLLLLALGIAAPFIEETVFRGYLYGRLRAYMDPIRAASLSGLIFAALHLSWSNLLPLAVIGYTLAITYERSRTLLAPMLLHAIWNLVEASIIIVIFR